MTAKIPAYIEVYKNIVEHYPMDQATGFAERESEVGTFRTWRDVRLESEMRFKADIGRPI